LLGRFAEPPSVGLERLHHGTAASVRIPPDALAWPWRVTVASNAPVTVCASGRSRRPAR
jgi:hypothetical protein